MRFTGHTAAIILLFISATVSAQFHSASSFMLQPVLQTKGSVLDSSGTYQLSSAAAALNIVIKQPASLTDFTSRATGISAGASLAAGDLYIGSPERHRMLINAGFGVTAITRKNKSTWIGRIVLLANEDEFTADKMKLRHNELLLYNRHVSETFQYRLGAAYTFLFGNPMAVPVAGLTFKNERSVFTVNFPFLLSYRYMYAAKAGLLVRIDQRGGMNRFTNRLNVPAVPQQVISLQRRSTALSIALPLYVSSTFIITPSVAALYNAFRFSEDALSGEYLTKNFYASNFSFGIKMTWFPSARQLQKGPPAVPGEEDWSIE